jgi:hypothetical protein
MSKLLRASLPPSAEDQGLRPAPDRPPGRSRVGPSQEPFSRFTVFPSLPAPFPEESLVADRRGELTPAQMVEQKLVSLLRGKAVPVSQIQMMRSLSRRR